MKDLIINIIEPLGFPIFQQGSLSEEEPYPDTFFTFWNNSSEDSSHYDNKPNNFIWDFDLNVYSINPEQVNILLLEAKKLLLEKGFIASGKGYDVASDEPTHIGRAINVQFIE